MIPYVLVTCGHFRPCGCGGRHCGECGFTWEVHKEDLRRTAAKESA